jgi:broad specificity phosphatase PhoE
MTFDLLFGSGSSSSNTTTTTTNGVGGGYVASLDTTKVSTTDRLAEWGYGSYEGLVTSEIRELRKQRGLDTDRPWDIWRDGCEGEGGE